jgi:prepilin peptidase CpaA
MPMLGLTFAQGAAVSVALAACFTDLKSRRVPNLLTFGATLAALVWGMAHGGLAGLGWAAAGWAAGLAVFLPFFLLRGIGGGDVKLVAAIGAWLGPVGALWVGAFGALAGGPLALIVAASSGHLKQAFANIWNLLTFWRVMGFKPHPGVNLDNTTAPRLPYAIPIFVGLVVTLWLQ